jgi:hypothetical protein
MQVLTMLGRDRQARVNIFVNEAIVVDNQVWQSAVPDAVLKYCGWWTTGAIQDDMRRMLGRQSSTFEDMNRVASCERAKYRRYRCLTPTIFCVNNGVPRELDLRDRRY